MPQIQNLIVAHIDPVSPVPEICAVISAVTPYHPGKEEEILRGVQDAIERRLDELKGEYQRDKPVL